MTTSSVLNKANDALDRTAFATSLKNHIKAIALLDDVVPPRTSRDRCGCPVGEWEILGCACPGRRTERRCCDAPQEVRCDFDRACAQQQGDNMTFTRTAAQSLTALLLALGVHCAHAADYPTPKEADWVAHDFRFHTGEVMADLRIHYTTIGTPGAPAVLVLHGTAGSGTSMLTSAFAGELFGPAPVVGEIERCHARISLNGVGRTKNGRLLLTGFCPWRHSTRLSVRNREGTAP